MKRAKLYAYSIILGFILFTQIPVYFTAITALKGEKEIYSSDITWFPQSPTLDNFRKVLMVEEERDFTTYIINSLGIAGISTLIVIVLGTLGGYAFSKYRFRGSDLLLLLILVIRVIPPVTLLTPLYKLATWLGIYDTWTILIWANVYLFLPFTIWLLKAFFDKFFTASHWTAPSLVRDGPAARAHAPARSIMPSYQARPMITPAQPISLQRATSSRLVTPPDAMIGTSVA